MARNNISNASFNEASMSENHISTENTTQQSTFNAWTGKLLALHNSDGNQTLNFYKLLWVFIIASVIGVVTEMIFIYTQMGYWQRSAGVLYGPLNQIYGMGAVIFTITLYRLRHLNFVLLFLISMIIGMLFEHCCSLIQQLLLGSVSWDYSQMASNIGGRTNWVFGLGWGAMGALYITFIWPLINRFIEALPRKVGKPLLIALSVLLVVNFVLTAGAVFRESQRLKGIPAGNAITKWIDKTYPTELLQEKFPNMTFV